MRRQAPAGLFLSTLNAGYFLLLTCVGAVAVVIVAVFVWNTILWIAR